MFSMHFLTFKYGFAFICSVIFQKITLIWKKKKNNLERNLEMGWEKNPGPHKSLDAGEVYIQTGLEMCK